GCWPGTSLPTSEGSFGRGWLLPCSVRFMLLAPSGPHAWIGTVRRPASLSDADDHAEVMGRASDLPSMYQPAHRLQQSILLVTFGITGGTISHGSADRTWRTGHDDPQRRPGIRPGRGRSRGRLAPPLP